VPEIARDTKVLLCLKFIVPPLWLKIPEAKFASPVMVRVLLVDVNMPPFCENAPSVTEAATPSKFPEANVNPPETFTEAL
jgi:hypothetical protein